MPNRELVIYLHEHDALIKSCGVKKKYRIIIPTVKIFKALTGLEPTVIMELELNEWLADIKHWMRMLEELPEIPIMSPASMKENRRRKYVEEQIKTCFTAKNRPLFMRISYGKAENLATYRQVHQLDYLGNPIQPA